MLADAMKAVTGAADQFYEECNEFIEQAVALVGTRLDSTGEARRAASPPAAA
jgi:hypothetical protein